MPASFNDLPAELRNLIYGMWLADDTTISTITISRALVQHLQATLHQPMVLKTTIHNHFGCTPALLSTCRQVRLEALDLWLNTAVFTYCSTDAKDPDRRIACDLMDVLEQMQLRVRQVKVTAKIDWAGLRNPIWADVGCFDLDPPDVGRSFRRSRLRGSAVTANFTSRISGLPREAWTLSSEGPFAPAKTTIFLQWRFR